MLTLNQTVITSTPGTLDFFITREFDAPKELVFNAYNNPKQIIQWLGPRIYTVKIEKFEPKSGGSWRYVFEDKNGSIFAFHGVFHDILVPEKIIRTSEYEGLSETGHVSLETATFERLTNDRSKVTTHVVYLSVADRDSMLQSDMESGLNESYERLDILLAKKMER